MGQKLEDTIKESPLDSVKNTYKLGLLAGLGGGLAAGAAQNFMGQEISSHYVRVGLMAGAMISLALPLFERSPNRRIAMMPVIIGSNILANYLNSVFYQ